MHGPIPLALSSNYRRSPNGEVAHSRNVRSGRFSAERFVVTALAVRFRSKRSCSHSRPYRLGNCLTVRLFYSVLSGKKSGVPRSAKLVRDDVVSSAEVVYAS